MIRFFKLLILSSVALFTVSSALFLVVWRVYYDNRFFPGVFLADQSVAGERLEEVLARASRVGESLRRDGIHVVVKTLAGEKTIVIPERSIGLTPDVVVDYFSVGDYENAVRSAFAVGRSGSFFENVSRQLSLLFYGEAFPYGTMLYPDSMRSLLARELTEQLTQPQDALFVREGASVAIQDALPGEMVDVAEVMKALDAAVRRMQTNRVLVNAQQLGASVTKEHLTPFLPFAQALARSTAFRFTYGTNNVVYVAGSRLASWLSLAGGEKGPALVVAEKPLREFVQRYINGDLPDSPRNSRFEMSGGVLREITPGQIGTVVDIEALRAQFAGLLAARYEAFIEEGPRAIAQGVDVPVSMRQEYPAVTKDTIAKFGITDLLGVATTSFRGSSLARIKNIRLGVELISGTLLAPGDEFSLVEALGEVTEEAGFEKEFVIKGDRSVKEAGGGLCQIATTAFRGVLDAGLPVTERRNHSYVVGYYGPGLDATIYGPHPDLKFVNDTGEYILFQMRVEGNNVVTEIYGKKDNRAVATSEPILFDYIDPPPHRYIPAPDKPWGEMECNDQPRRGLTAQATTTVTYADGSVRTQVFDSVYQPWPKICLVGIKTQ